MSVSEAQLWGSAMNGLPQAVGSEGLSDEGWLVAKAKAGHEDAFGELYRRHQLRAYRTALRILRNQQDAEDAVQRAFQRALLNLGRFRGDSAFSTWLTRIAINEALMLLRKRRGGEPLERGSGAEQQDGGLEIAEERPTPEEIACQTERRAMLHQAIGKLRKSLKVVVVLRELQGRTSAETAQILGLSVGAVKARTFHARRVLRKHLHRRLARNGWLAVSRKSKAHF